MPTIGNINLNLHTVDRDETVYATEFNSVSKKDVIALRRTPSTTKAPNLRTQIRHEKTLAAAKEGDPGKNVTVSIAVTVPPGLTDVSVKDYVANAVTQSAQAMAELAVSGDIHL